MLPWRAAASTCRLRPDSDFIPASPWQARHCSSSEAAARPVQIETKTRTLPSQVNNRDSLLAVMTPLYICCSLANQHRLWYTALLVREEHRVNDPHHNAEANSQRDPRKRADHSHYDFRLRLLHVFLKPARGNQRLIFQGLVSL